MLTATGYFAQRLAQCGIDAPTAQSTANYALLSLHGIPLYLRRRRERRAREGTTALAPSQGQHCSGPSEAAPRLRPWQWLLLALVDVEANYMLVLAYQYTDITSVSLLDAFTVPSVMLFSRLLFHARYTLKQARWRSAPARLHPALPPLKGARVAPADARRRHLPERPRGARAV